jgi:hypothetical protein
MLTSGDYKALSDRSAQLAIASSSPSVAQALMGLAFDYATRAAKLGRTAAEKQHSVDGFGD